MAWRVVRFVLLPMLAASAAAQCQLQWQPGPGTLGVHGSVGATVAWDEDGAGPIGPKVIVGGEFDSAGTAVANNLAAYDIATGAWSQLGGGTNGFIRAFTIDNAGALVVGGGFTMAGTTPANGIARWNGTSWQPFGAGTVSAVYALARLPNGDLVAGGTFTTAGTVAANRIARWNGSTWSPIGTGMNGAVLALAVLLNGDLVAGGQFTQAGGVGANRIARWNGTTWLPFGTGMTGYPAPWIDFSAVSALAVDGTGGLIAGGQFLAAGGLPIAHVARWSGSQWQSIGWPAGIVHSLLVRANNEVIAAGEFAGGVMRFQGTSWSPIGGGFGPVGVETAMALAELPNGDVVASGWYQTGGAYASILSRWNGAVWSPMSPGIDGPVQCLASLASGDLIVGGSFLTIAGADGRRIARWDGAAWHALGSGFDGVYVVTVAALLPMPDGSLIAGGQFQNAGGQPASNIARWNGTTWQALGSGTDGSVASLALLPNGDVAVGGSFTLAGGVAARSLARWDGTNWHALGAPLTGTNPLVNGLATLANGDLVVGGFFTGAGTTAVTHVARWDGVSWHAYPSLSSGYVWCVQPLRDGRFAIGGDFTIASAGAEAAARWNGTAWQPVGPANLGGGRVRAIEELPNGDLVVGGEIWQVGSQVANHVLRSHGSNWQTFGGALTGVGGGGGARDLLWTPHGHLVVAGAFEFAGGSVSRSLARLTTPCMPAVMSIATPCIGPAGPVSLIADTQPWTGAPFRSTATGFAHDSIAVSVFAFGISSTPLAVMHPSGLPNCTLVPAPEVIVLSLPFAGVAHGNCAFANDPVWAGVLVQHQFVQGQFDPSFQLLSLSSSNALVLTVGTY